MPVCYRMVEPGGDGVCSFEASATLLAGFYDFVFSSISSWRCESKGIDATTSGVNSRSAKSMSSHECEYIAPDRLVSACLFRAVRSKPTCSKSDGPGAFPR